MDIGLKIGGISIALAVFFLELFSLWFAFKEREERRQYIAATNRIIKEVRAEETARAAHLASMETVAKLYTRAEYESLIRQRIDSAQKALLCYWYSLHQESAGESYARINQSLHEAIQKRTVTVKVITAQEKDRIAPAFELGKLGVEVRFYRALPASDLRFMLADETWVILGVPGTPGMGLARALPSHEGVEFIGAKLRSILADYFDRQWSVAERYDEFAGSRVKEFLEDKNPMELVCMELGLPLEEVTRLDNSRRGNRD